MVHGSGVLLPDGPFGCIYADPPWSFRTYSGGESTPHRSAHDHYRTMDAPSLAAIPVERSAAKDCALFMWIVSSHLDQAITLGRVWGFDFKTIAFCWVKTRAAAEAQGFLSLDAMMPPVTRMGMGYWTRQEMELCLLFTRGAPRRKSGGVRQVIFEPRRQHSRKPDGVRDRIQTLVDGPYLEMFARQSAPGWQVWGNETDKFSVSGVMPGVVL
ncbi:modification methylase MunI [alpha proteobacterium Q-1]|nr:MT-A70 family methyltransferase [Iodidimonas nitroreducens]GAK33266.1 modification methylase MunI [alpha proteobacterium Q-1]